jgi:hypothetical protein
MARKATDWARQKRAEGIAKARADPEGAKKYPGRKRGTKLLKPEQIAALAIYVEELCRRRRGKTHIKRYIADYFGISYGTLKKYLQDRARDICYEPETVVGSLEEVPIFWFDFANAISTEYKKFSFRPPQQNSWVNSG